MSCATAIASELAKDREKMISLLMVDLRLLVRSFPARAIARHTLSARRRQDATGEIRTSGPP
jgi:hypothetical protein